MTLIYQPISRTFGQRDGCPTPNTLNDDKQSQLAPEVPRTKSNNLMEQTSEVGSKHEILSPPLSPYRKAPESRPAVGSPGHARTPMVFLTSESPYKLENFKSYSLTLSPWKSLGSGYKERHFEFLRHYNLDPKEVSPPQPKVAEKKVEKRKRKATSSSESESDSHERMRTRRDTKESLLSQGETKDLELVDPIQTTPKRRRTRKEPAYVGSPLAAQQAAFIDESIPDYSPDAQATLPKNNSRALKIEWKGQPMDLKNDPYSDKLHPAELFLASTLRLPCNVYLDSRRRFFFEKVHRMKEHKPFRRTDAQKACRIDVNKASRLFAAFEKVGWLDDKHFTKYL